MELRLPLEMSPGRDAACRAVFGTWVFFRTMHGKTAPSCGLHSQGGVQRGVRASGSYQEGTGKSGCFATWKHPRGHVWNVVVRPASSCGATGKSAQIPLYVWLPDAMVGPTPVSALIHAATMVTAGVYMVARLNFLFSMAPSTMAVVATIGTLTAFFAATIGTTQDDIKKVLAYS